MTAATKIQPVYKKIGKAILRHRSELNITQDALATRVKLSRGSIANVEGGKQRLLVHQLIDLARVLKVPLDRLM